MAAVAAALHGVDEGLQAGLGLALCGGKQFHPLGEFLVPHALPAGFLHACSNSSAQ